MNHDVINSCRELINSADLILIGAGAGLSASAGLEYGGTRFINNFPDYIKKYGLTDMYSSAFYPYPTLEEFWGYFSRHIKLNRYDFKGVELYGSLLELVKNKNYFVITTNADALFYKSGFDKNKVFSVQGDYAKFQCQNACHNKLYDNNKVILQMVEEQSDCKIPSELQPMCPVCGGNMFTNLRVDNNFVEDDYWRLSSSRYIDFINNISDKKLVLLELGVGFNTPAIIRYPFEKMAIQNEESTLIRINRDNLQSYFDIPESSILIQGDIKEVINNIAK